MFPVLTSKQFYRLLRRARWGVPFALVVLVFVFEFYEHGVGQLESGGLRTSFWVDLLFFGGVGPVVVGLALHWMSEMLRRLVEAEAHREKLYQALQAKEEARRQLLTFVIHAQEEERKRVARELHDGISQSLTTFVFITDQLSLPEVPQQRRLETARQAAKQALEAIRQLIPDLRPPLLDRVGLTPTLRRFVEDLFQGQDVVVDWQVKGKPVRMDVEVELTLFRILQEALNNVYRHAAARNLEVRLEFIPEGVRARVSDDGRGFDPAQIRPSRENLRGVGLLGMEERAAIINGQLKLESSPGEGTSVEVYVPYKK